VRYLERQVEEEREARRRADMLLARLVERVPEIEAPQDTARESAEPRPAAGSAQGEAGAEPRSWWRRVVFGD
jgi:hypothetical protein